MHKIDPSKLSTNYLNNYDAAFNLVEEAWDSHETYWQQIRNFQDHIKGKKPRDPKKLRDKNIGWAANFNYGKARAKHERGTSENVAKIKDAIFLSVPEIRRDIGDDKDIEFLNNHIDREITTMAISSVLYDTYERDARFSAWLNQIEYPSFSFGYSTVVRDPSDWMGTPVHPLEIAFEDKTEPDEVRAFVVFDNMKAIDLYSRWIETRNLKVDEMLDDDCGEEHNIKTNGWSIEALEEILYYAYGDNGTKEQRSDNENWEQILPRFEDNPQECVRNTQNVGIAKIFYRNLDKSWDEVYIPYNNEFINNDETAVDLIMYKENHGKMSQSDLMVLIADSGFTETKFIQDMRGLAKFSVPDSVRYNRKRNSIEDKLTFAGQPMFAKPNTQIGEGLKIGVSQGFTVVDNGFTLLPTQPNFDLGSHIASINLDEREHMRDTTQFDAKIEGRTSSRPTRSEIASISSEVQASALAKNSVKLGSYAQLVMSNLKWISTVAVPDEGDASYNSYQYFYEELSYQLKMYLDEKNTKAENRMIIKKIIKNIVGVRIDTFMGDPEAIAMAMQMAETPFGRNRMKRILLMAQGIPRREIPTLAPLVPPQDGSDQRFAAFENDMFLTSAENTFMDSDDHIEHMTSHQNRVEKVKGKVQQGAMELQAAFAFLANSLSHQERHLRALEVDPVLNGEQFEEKHKENIKFLEGVKQGVEQQAREAARNQPLPHEEQKHQDEMRRLDEKAAAKEQRTDELTRNRAINNARSAEFQRELDKQDHEQEMAQKQREAALNNDIEVTKKLTKL